MSEEKKEEVNSSASVASEGESKAKATAQVEGGSESEKAKPARPATPRTAAAKAKKEGEDGEAPKEKKPSPLQPQLDEYVSVINSSLETELGESPIEKAYNNETSKECPTLIIKRAYFRKVFELLKSHQTLRFDYLSNLQAVDYETHIESQYFFYSFAHNRSIAVRVKLDRSVTEVESVTDLWAAADWNEREAYDLMGINYLGHPNLKRIMLPDDWVGHPLRKDYEPFDEGV
jgi:NADH-quinone oxidoreductase subunit C